MKRERMNRWGGGWRGINEEDVEMRRRRRRRRRQWRDWTTLAGLGDSRLCRVIRVLLPVSFSASCNIPVMPWALCCPFLLLSSSSPSFSVFIFSLAFLFSFSPCNGHTPEFIQSNFQMTGWRREISDRLYVLLLLFY